MAVGTDKILGQNGAGLIGDDGKLTPLAKNKFIIDVSALQIAGNKNGLGISKTNPLIQLPIPPFSGPTIPGVPLIKESEQLFWFNPDPYAALSIPFLLDDDGAYNKYIIKGLYEPLAKMLNVDGKTSLGPIFDPTIFLNTKSKKFSNLTLEELPQILIELVLLGNLSQIKPAPGLAAETILFSDYGITSDKVSLDLVTLILNLPTPEPPTIKIPKIPDIVIPNAGKANIILPDIMKGLFESPTIVFPQLIGELTTSISINPLELISKIIKIIFDIIIKILESIGIIIGPINLLSATLCILIKNLAAMLLCCLVGSLFGTGLIVKIISKLSGLT